MLKQLKYKPRVLVIDDDPAFRTLTVKTMADEDFEALGAGTGHEALEAVKARSYDVALLDVNMPDMDGRSVLRVIREVSPLTDVVMVTGHQDLRTAVELLKLGAREYITKPIEPVELLQRLKSIAFTHQAESRLRETQREFSSRLLSELLAPLGTMETTIDFLARGDGGELSGQQRKMLQTLRASFAKMRALLNDMIDLTLLESGSVELQKLPTNIDEMIPAVCARLRSEAAAKKISITLDIADDVPTIELDQEKFEQVLFNLLDNAIKYTDAGGAVVVKASAGLHSLGGRRRDCVEIAVSDTGIGIAREELPLVFDKHKEILTGKTSAQKTTGLGLAISRSIIEAHQGTLSANSTVGSGSTFSILVPTDVR
jgi:signal transduction histidine kinase